MSGDGQQLLVCNFVLDHVHSRGMLGLLRSVLIAFLSFFSFDIVLVALAFSFLPLDATLDTI